MSIAHVLFALLSASAITLSAAAGETGNDPTLAVRVLEAEVTALKRENGQLQGRLASLEARMLAFDEAVRPAAQRLEIIGNRQTNNILLRPAASFIRVAGQPTGVSINQRETLVRAERILIEGEEIVLNGRRLIRLVAPDIVIEGQRTAVKGSPDTVIGGNKIRKN